MSGTDPGYKTCPHCNKVDHLTGGLFSDSLGDGLCKKCEGTGKGIDSSAWSREIFVKSISLGTLDPDVNFQVPCSVCSGTGQCQTCGGNGQVLMDRSSNKSDARVKDNDDEIEENDASELDENDDEYSSFNPRYLLNEEEREVLCFQEILEEVKSEKRDMLRKKSALEQLTQEFPSDIEYSKELKEVNKKLEFLRAQVTLLEKKIKELSIQVNKPINNTFIENGESKTLNGLFEFVLQVVIIITGILIIGYVGNALWNWCLEFPIDKSRNVFSNLFYIVVVKLILYCIAVIPGILYEFTGLPRDSVTLFFFVLVFIACIFGQKELKRS